ncbi:MAG: CvpA family protein [Proteobacteria bacterium]|nr:CvpA family protein [Pseudomonadota bacterium]
MSLAFTLVDALVVVVILGSMAFAIWRGFIDETLSIVAWAAAAFAALFFGPWVSRMAHGLIETAWIATVVGYGVVFVAIFIPISFASHRFSQSVKRSAVGPLDRVLGATFGIVRGLAILGIAYLVFTAFVPIREQPRWLTEARTLPLIQSSSEVLLALVPDQGGRDTTPPAAAGPAHPQTIEDLLPTPKPDVKPAKHGKKAYGADDRHALDRLIESTASGGTGKP